jgi:hypothetical protein
MPPIEARDLHAKRRFAMKSVVAMALAGALGLLSAPAFAWDWPFGAQVLGSGQITKTQRQVTGFKGLSLDLPSNVEIVQGDAEGVLIETDDNIAPLIETVVEGNQLKIRLAQRSASIKPGTLKITVNARTIDSIAIAGSGDVKAAKLESGNLATQISGSGAIRITTLKVDSLSVSISGNGDFRAGGHADSVRASISGSGNIRTATLMAKDVKLSIAGSGNARVRASQTLKVSIAGSGDVGYYGDPAVSQSVAGSGSIRKLGAAASAGE